MKTLYLVRHGKTEANKKEIYQSEKAMLSEEGRKQAVILQKRFASIAIDIIYTSPLLRAKETAEIINETLRVPMETSDFLKERGEPSSLIEKQFSDPEAVAFRKEVLAHQDDLLWKWKDEESIGEVRDRVAQFLEDRKQNAENNILVVTHTNALKLMLAVVLVGMREEALLYHAISGRVSVENTGITVLRLRDEDKNWRLVTWNDHAHLGELHLVA